MQAYRQTHKQAGNLTDKETNKQAGKQAEKSKTHTY